MASWMEVLQNVASVTRHVAELQAEQRTMRADTEARLRALEQMVAQASGANVPGRMAALEQSVAALTQAVARLEEARATTRAEVRAEITSAVAELRVRYSEERAQQHEAQALPTRRDD